jgi:uncharacterized membrane protein
MVSPTPPPNPQPIAAGSLRALLNAIRTRIVSGLLLALPIVLTFWIIYWLYTTVKQAILDPLVDVLGNLFDNSWSQTSWWNQFVNPLIAVVLVVTFLYCLGLIARSWIARVIDWVLLRVPVVTTIYKALSNVFQSIGNQYQNQRNQRVVLVEFPHPGIGALAFVTNTLHDPATGKTILSVCVLTGVFPPAGFTLFVPEESVRDVDWSMNQTLQAILSGGITAPSTIRFFDGSAHAHAAGPIIDTHGHPIETHRVAEEPSIPG